MTRHPPLLFALACFAASAIARSAEPDPPAGMISLTNGDHVAGRLADSSSSDSLAWRTPLFVDPLQFSLPTVNTVHLSSPDKLVRPQGDYCFELAAGDVLYGSLIALDDQSATINETSLGTLSLDRRILRRIVRWNEAAELIYQGPNGLAGWTAGKASVPIPVPKDQVILGGQVFMFGAVGNAAPPANVPEADVQPLWREDGGQLWTDVPDAQLSRDVGLPERAKIELALSWTKPSQFSLAFGPVDNFLAPTQSYRLEAWENDVVALRETSQRADLAKLAAMEPGSGRLHLQMFLDQAQGRWLIYSPEGEQLADLSVPAENAQIGRTVQLIHFQGETRLEFIKIGRWNGEVPRAHPPGQGRIVRKDGSIVTGELQSYAAESRTFTLATETGAQSIPEAELDEAVFPASADLAPSTVRVIHLAGLQLRGRLVKVAADELWLDSPGIAGTLRFPIAALHVLLRVPAEEESARPAEPAAVAGRLEWGTNVLHGRLVDAREGETGCLRWQPFGSSSSSPLERHASARIVYTDRAPPTKTETPAAEARRPVPRRSVIGQLFAALPTRRAPHADGKCILHLRSGDQVGGDVTSIDEKGVHLESEATDADFIPHEQLQAVELQPQVTPVQILKNKKERLLMLPRMQRDSPPTQLIRSIHGDYIRGRLISMTDDELVVEIRLKNMTIPRDRVARILWLHPEDSDDAPQTPPADPAQGLRVQALSGNGRRQTFRPEAVADNVLTGRSAVLGTCRVDLRQIDQLLIGREIEASAESLAFHQWQLTPAPDPRFVGEESEDHANDGRDSSLVGKPAPDFKLDLHGGGSFRLADRRGKIVVLDFWASWCAECITALPQVRQAVQPFEDRGVEFVGVNLEDPAERVKATLDRLKLTFPVALDETGRIAQRYGVTAIPQTVIVDQEGNIARVYIGGRPNFEEQLRSALESLLTGDRPPAESTANE